MPINTLGNELVNGFQPNISGYHLSLPQGFLLWSYHSKSILTCYFLQGESITYDLTLQTIRNDHWLDNPRQNTGYQNNCKNLRKLAVHIFNTSSRIFFGIIKLVYTYKTNQL